MFLTRPGFGQGRFNHGPFAVNFSLSAWPGFHLGVGLKVGQLHFGLGDLALFVLMAFPHQTDFAGLVTLTRRVGFGR